MQQSQRLRDYAKVLGAALAGAGLVLLASAGAYFGYSAYARGQLDELNYTVDGPAQLQPGGSSQLSSESPSRADSLPPASTLVPASSSQLASADDAPATDLYDMQEPAGLPPAAASGPQIPEYLFTSLYPGGQIHPKYWDQPMWAGTDARLSLDLPAGFQPATDLALFAPRGDGAVAQQMRIPIIGVNSPVGELQILDLGNSRQYETPDNIVGHIPETSGPGEAGNGWFFGHLENRLRGEGNVFGKLPEIPKHLRDGDPVSIFLDTADGEYLYQVMATRVVHQDDLHLYDSEGATITLVTCVPSLVYDHRLLVTATLVGIRK